ncbi:hypothetical protein SERLADRAFT_463336 [Serpula lacrymans var. lacrymans S7.9]|uniref:Uncharacterized protein n=1 Tax=Serpula lacrymans var. lacrymans (strain S7.9) TaxID=578457 RepID=F8NRZ5_SERL9|nr:uncharacterized protein SERLADRAFT_463336 [Serpula lacrymans var. lacrymans S7.9]EGO26357.1 hypothetical protein SERLADRAFT_463336 [Serpula lacrymans var. lacrymans S7.9]
MSVTTNQKERWLNATGCLPRTPTPNIHQAISRRNTSRRTVLNLRLKIRLQVQRRHKCSDWFSNKNCSGKVIYERKAIAHSSCSLG